MVYDRPADGMWGEVDHITLQTSGVVGEVARGEADYSPSPYFETALRARVLAFSYSIADG